MPVDDGTKAASMQHRSAAGVSASTSTSAAAAAGMDVSSGADLGLIDAYLQQLLPALAKATSHSTAQKDSLGQLGLSRDALLAAGLPQHGINALYRAMAAHAGAFRKMVAGEVKELRSLLTQQAAPQLSSTIQLLDGPIASAGSGAGGKASKAVEACALPALAAAAAGLASVTDAAVAGAVAADADIDSCSDTGLPAGAFSSMADVLSSLGPTANDLVKDYAEAYASMKENMEIRLRHEQRRGDFLQGKVQQTEGTLKDVLAQLDSAQRRIADQRVEQETLAGQHAELQQSLAVSHAAHLALQHHHQAQMEAWRAERQDMEQQHKQQLEALQQELSSSSAAAAALVDSNRQVEALRLLYNEELGRASRLAVELSKATAAADKAAAQEAVWAKQIATSDTRADNAEGMAAAMDVSVKQLEVQLQHQQQELASKEADGVKLRLLLERSRLTAVAEAAAARAMKASLTKEVQQGQSQLKETSSALTATNDQLKLCKMELEGANAQLQAGRSHMKQLISDLEIEQEKCAGLATALDEAKVQVSTATSAAEVAEARLKSTQEQLNKANDTAVAAQDKVYQLQEALEVQTATHEALQVAHETISREHAALEAEASSLRTRLSELIEVQQQLAEVQVQHDAATARLAQLEEQNEGLAAKAEQLLVTTFELQELQQQHNSLQASQQQQQQQLDAASHDLAEAKAAEQASEAQVQQLQEELEAANLAKAQLARELLATSAAGDSAQSEITTLSQQLDDVQAALEAAEADRQALAAQRDGWMSSFQEAYGKLQEWTVCSEAAARKLATRAGALQSAMQNISSQAQASAAAEDNRAAVGGNSAKRVNSPLNAASAAAGGTVCSASVSTAATNEVMDQLAGLQQLVQAEAHKQQEVFDNTLKALHDRVQERHQAAHSSWQETMAAANARRAQRAAAKAAERARKKQHNLTALAATNSHATKLAAAAVADSGAVSMSRLTGFASPDLGGDMGVLMQQIAAQQLNCGGEGFAATSPAQVGARSPAGDKQQQQGEQEQQAAAQYQQLVQQYQALQQQYEALQQQYQLLLGQLQHLQQQSPRGQQLQGMPQPMQTHSAACMDSSANSCSPVMLLAPGNAGNADHVQQQQQQQVDQALALQQGGTVAVQCPAAAVAAESTSSSTVPEADSAGCCSLDAAAAAHLNVNAAAAAAAATAQDSTDSSNTPASISPAAAAAAGSAAVVAAHEAAANTMASDEAAALASCSAGSAHADSAVNALTRHSQPANAAETMTTTTSSSSSSSNAAVSKPAGAALVMPLSATGDATLLGTSNSTLQDPSHLKAPPAASSSQGSPSLPLDLAGVSSPRGLPAVQAGGLGKLGSFGSFNSSSAGVSSPGGMVCGGSLSGFVSLATYQEQMQAVAKLHGQVGQLAVQLREAHADAEGAQDSLQRERQEASTRTTAMREALGQLHGQLEELREDHKQLQESHRALITKDLLNSGLLRDRYVADLFDRLQEALWKLDTARKRAATWGFDMLVPLGRVNRGIQTQPGEIWASTGAAGSAAAGTADHAGSSNSRKRIMLLAAGADLSAEADPEAAASRVLSGRDANTQPGGSTVSRKSPAFTQHSTSNRSSDKAHAAMRSMSGSAGDTGNSAAVADTEQDARLLSDAADLVAAGGVQWLPVGKLLKLIASLYSAKATADAQALSSHHTPHTLWAFVLRRLRGPSSSCDVERSEVVTALAQLLGSVQEHAGACKEVAAFQAALLGSIPAAAASMGATHTASRPDSAGSDSSSRTTPRASAASARGTGVTFRGTWGELRLDDNKLLPAITPDLLLPEGVTSLLQQVVSWPGMSALLAWVSGGHFLGGLGPDDLGRALLDVQAPHIHFLLLEAADILRLHPLPRLHVVKAPAPFVRLLRIPVGSMMPSKAAAWGTTNNKTSNSSSSAVPKCQRATILVLSSAAMQLLEPAELQAAMSGALAPLALEGSQDDADSETPGPGSPSTACCSGTAACDPSAPALADLATLASLLALTPAFLLGHLPSEMHAMGGFLAAALLAVERLIGAVGDRASLLVCQDVGSSLRALLKTAPAGGTAVASTDGVSDGVGEEDPAGIDRQGVDRDQALIKQWQRRVQQQQEQQQEPITIHQLLPHHKHFAAATAGGGSISGDGQLSDDQALLLRVQELLAWAGSQQYAELMAAARPLRRVVRPGSAGRSSIKSA